MEDDWDLQAVVRGCSTASTTGKPSTTTTTTTTTTNNFNISGCFHSSSSVSPVFSSSLGQTGQHQQQSQFLFSSNSNPVKPRNVVEELHELYKPFFPKSQPSLSIIPPPLSSQITTPPNLSPLTPLTSLSSISSPTTQPQHQHQHHHHHHHHLQQRPKSTSSATTAPRSKKRKNQLKKVCEVPEESISSDIWAWRKYGQKPIKGSPYPRGYYRCSSSKGCMARKQVERNRSDPNMFIVTYAAEHNHPAPTHRNSLAGSTRQKAFSPQSGSGGGESAKPTTPKPCSPATSTSVGDEAVVARRSAAVESSKEEKGSPATVDDEDDEMFDMCDSVVSDDFFVGLEGFAGGYFSDQSPASFGMPWISSHAATAAGSI